jgi:hypothetical protein
MRTEPFPHGFTERFGHIPIDQIEGYQLALKHIYDHIFEVTQMKPEHRYIDSVHILDRLSATTDELIPLLEEAEKQLQELGADLLNFKLTEK